MKRLAQIMNLYPRRVLNLAHQSDARPVEVASPDSPDREQEIYCFACGGETTSRQCERCKSDDPISCHVSDGWSFFGEESESDSGIDNGPCSAEFFVMQEELEQDVVPMRFLYPDCDESGEMVPAPPLKNWRGCDDYVPSRVHGDEWSVSQS